jgi:hypothetical protein
VAGSGQPSTKPANLTAGGAKIIRKGNGLTRSKTAEDSSEAAEKEADSGTGADGEQKASNRRTSARRRRP